MWVGIAVIAVLVAAGFLIGRMVITKPRANDLAVSTDEPLPVNSNPGYIGIESCAECHQERVAEFRLSRHRLAARPASDDTITAPLPSPALRFEPRLPETDFQISRNADAVEVTRTEHTSAGDQRDVSRFAFVYGSNGMGDEVYFNWKQDRLFEQPVVWLRPQQTWAVQSFADSFDASTHERGSTNRCLECHHTWFEQVTGSENQYRPDSFLVGITCERCHGPAKQHVERHRAAPSEKTPQAIIRPATLDRERKIDICGQCHAASIFRKTPLFSFQPGDVLEDHFRLHVEDGVENDHVADQVGYLRKSKCFEKSEMTCADCHSPHHQTPPEEVGLISCLKCHERQHCGRREQLPEEVRDNCVGCHMPRYQRVAVKFHGEKEQFQFPMRPRQHRIGIYPDAEKEVIRDGLVARGDDESRKRAREIETELVEKWIADSDVLKKNHRFVAAMGPLRDVERLGHREEIVDRLDELIEIQTKLDQALPKAMSLANRKRIPDAIQVLEESLILKPDFAKAHGRLGTFYSMRGERERAFQHLARVSKDDPNEPYGENMMGWLCYLEGRNEEAARYFEKADSIYPFQPDINERWGLALLRSKDWTKAVERFRVSLLGDPRDAVSCQGLAHALSQSGQHDEAARSARKAAALVKYENVDILITLADVLQAKGETEEAAKVARKAINLCTFRNPELAAQLSQRFQSLLQELTPPDDASP